MSDQTPGAPQNPPVEPPAQPAAPAAPAPEPPAAPAPPAQPVAAPPPAQPTPPPAQPAAPAPAAAPAAPAPAAPVVPPPAPTAAPAAPGAPVPPAYGTAAPPPGGSGNFKSGKNKTIALIVGGVIAVGAIGGVAALLAGGGDDSKEVSTSAAAPPEGSGVLEPAPVGSTDPAEPDDGPTDGPTDAPTSEAPPSDTAEPEPAPEPVPDSGGGVTIGGNIAIPVPTGWEVLGVGDVDVALSDGGANYVYAVTGTVKPSADAGQVLMNSLESILPPDQYPDLATSDVVPQQPGGSIVSLALLEYEGTWTDGQGTTAVHGAVFSAVRQDGVALILLAEHTPPGEFGDVYSTQLQPVMDGILLPFAGLG